MLNNLFVSVIYLACLSSERMLGVDNYQDFRGAVSAFIKYNSLQARFRRPCNFSSVGGMNQFWLSGAQPVSEDVSKMLGSLSVILSGWRFCIIPYATDTVENSDVTFWEFEKLSYIRHLLSVILSYSTSIDRCKNRTETDVEPNIEFDAINSLLLRSIYIYIYRKNIYSI